jgi:hypothetical protein
MPTMWGPIEVDCVQISTDPAVRAVQLGLGPGTRTFGRGAWVLCGPGRVRPYHAAVDWG